MLLIKQPLPFISFAVSKGINAVPLTLTFREFAFVKVSVFKDYAPFSLRFPCHHLAFIGSLYAHLLNGTRA